ncbi:putative kinase domain protein [Rhizoctonia solani 123E]|uniref:Putative kinase domain protein n=1 Tax=Rhizoctonia solani 123E TaxID=1423351 RepID=A0A074RTP9_9AGAM|nr:putative kinase domain protein [Rhizoctonia solani 123E]
MADPHEDKITLNILVEGDDPALKMLIVTVPLQNQFLHVRPIIQKAYWESEQISIYGLRLYRSNLPFKQAEHAQLSNETLLHVNKRVASEWPSSSSVNEDMIHIIVRPTSRQITNTHKAITPPPPQTEFEQFIQNFKTDRSKFVQSVRAKKTSSAVVALPQNFLEQQGDDDFINIGSPVDKARLSIVLYHEVFGRFIRGLRSSHLHSEVYRHTEQHSPVPHLDQVEPGNPQAKDDLTRASLCYLLGDTLQRIKTNGAEADGVITGTNLAYLVIMKISTGSSDPSIQAARSYKRYWSDIATEDWLNWCCCPSILIAITGPWMRVLGAIFLDRPVVQPLTDFLWVGEDLSQPSKSNNIVCVFHCINQARIELDRYYRAHHPPPPGESIVSPFPYLTHYLDLTGQIVHFAYRKSLCPANPEKSIFLAEIEDPKRPRPIVVKFVPKYNADAHRLLAKHGFAPQLLYDGTMYPDDQPGPDHIMVVMDFVQGANLQSPGSSQLPRSVFNDIEAAIKILHSRDFVFGDLREPNMMVLQDSMGRATGKAMLVDFDWCGKHLEGKYPQKMNMELGWHGDVEPRAVMDKQHDIHMLAELDGSARFSL